MNSIKRTTLIAAAVMVATVAFASPAFALPHALITAWEPTAVCSTCHGDFVNTWSQSMHAQALTDPVYRYKITQADLATGGSVTPLCTTCHGPLATMANEIVGANLSGVSAQGMQGVACEFCHHAKEATETPDAFLGNTSQLIIPQPSPVTRATAAPGTYSAASRWW